MPSETSKNNKITVSPTPFVEVTDTDSNVSPTPLSTRMVTGAASTATIRSNPGLFNEDNFTKYFRFGMTISAVEKELNVLKIEIADKTNDDTHLQLEGIQSGLWRICTEHAQFDFDQNKRLYMIVSDWETAKGFAPGDSVEILHQLYGKEDEIELGQFLNSSDFIYKRKDNYFSVEINDITIEDEDRRNFQKLWKVFVDIWNDPHILDKGTNSGHFMDGNFGSDDCIQFNEENFTADFPFGMKRQELINKLNSKRVRITAEESWIGNGDDDESVPGEYVGCFVSSDHVSFVFNSKNRLDSICVYGWPTGKGLKRGDTEEKLLQLYGNAINVLKNAGDSGYDKYTYSMNRYVFELQFGDYFHQRENALDFWSVYVGK